MKEIGRLRLRAGNCSGVVLLQLALEKGALRWASELRLEAEGLTGWTAADAGSYEDESLSSVFLIACFDAPREEYLLRFGMGPASVSDHTETRLEHGPLTLDLLGFTPALRVKGRLIAELKSDLRLDGRRVAFDRGNRKLLHLGGQGEGLRHCGVIKVPGETAPGSYLFDFFRLPGLGCLFARCVLQYPQTGGNTRWDAVSPFRWEMRDGQALSAPPLFAGKTGDGYLLLAGCTELAGGVRAEGGALQLDALGRQGDACRGAWEQALLALFADQGEDWAADAEKAAALLSRPTVLEAEGAVRAFTGENRQPGKAVPAAAAEETPPRLGSRLRNLLRRGSPRG